MRQAAGGGSDGASVGVPGASVPAFATTPPPSRTPRKRRTPRPGAGKSYFLILHNYRIVASLGLDKLSLVALGVVLNTGVDPNLVRRNALSPDWFRQVVPPRRNSRYASRTPTTRGCALAVPSRCGFR